jgi:hypothetical protein
MIEPRQHTSDPDAARRILLTIAAEQWSGIAQLRHSTPGERAFADIMEATARTMLAELRPRPREEGHG